MLIGSEPRTDWLAGALARDRWGFLLTGAQLLADDVSPGWPLDRPPALLETSTPGVFAAGDVRAGSVKRVASAVGEGALAVTLVHAHLASLDPGAGLRRPVTRWGSSRVDRRWRWGRTDLFGSKPPGRSSTVRGAEPPRVRRPRATGAAR